MSVKLLLNRLQGGVVQRYHTAPSVGGGQNVAAHTWRAMVILHTLWPDTSKEALLYMLYHDVAESQLGDLPATTKWKFDDLHNHYMDAEYEVEKDLEVSDFTCQSDVVVTRRVKMADLLELVLHAKQQFDNGNREAWEVYRNGVNYLLKYFKGTEDFGPVLEVLIKLRLPEPLELTDWL